MNKGKCEDCNKNSCWAFGDNKDIALHGCFTPKKENEKMKHEFVDLSLRLIDVIQMDYCDESYIEKYHEFSSSTKLLKPLSSYSEHHQERILKWILNDRTVLMWCIENNIIREKKEGMFYKRGEIFTDKHGELCILCQTGWPTSNPNNELLMQMIHIAYENGLGGNGFAIAAGVSDVQKITQTEFNKIVDGDILTPFTKVEVEIKIKNLTNAEM